MHFHAAGSARTFTRAKETFLAGAHSLQDPIPCTSLVQSLTHYMQPYALLCRSAGALSNNFKHVSKAGQDPLLW